MEWMLANSKGLPVSANDWGEAASISVFSLEAWSLEDVILQIAFVFVTAWILSRALKSRLKRLKGES